MVGRLLVLPSSRRNSCRRWIGEVLFPKARLTGYSGDWTICGSKRRALLDNLRESGLSSTPIPGAFQRGGPFRARPLTAGLFLPP